MLFSKYISIGPNGKNAKKRKHVEKRATERKKKESNQTKTNP
jgi:hypothetical protein